MHELAKKIIDLGDSVELIGSLINHECLLPYEESLREYIEKKGKDCLSQREEERARISIYVKSDKGCYFVNDFGDYGYCIKTLQETVTIFGSLNFMKIVVIPEILPEKFIVFTFNNKYLVY